MDTSTLPFKKIPEKKAAKFPNSYINLSKCSVLVRYCSFGYQLQNQGWPAEAKQKIC